MNRIRTLIQDYKDKKVKPTEVIIKHLNKINDEDGHYNSFITVTGDLAYDQAREIEQNLTHEMTDDKPLLGIPISYKDSIDVKGTFCTNGSELYKNKKSSTNASIVSELQKKGAVTIGKNNMYELSSGVFSTNVTFGDVINARNPKITAGGSSSGSAVSVSRKFCLASIGTDTSGSIRIPAAMNGVIGFKPSINWTSHKGVTPLSTTLDHLGIISSSTENIEIVYNAILDKEKIMKQVPIIGIPQNYLNVGFDVEVDRAFSIVVKMLSKIFVCKKIDDSFLTDETLSVSRTIGTSEFGFLQKSNFEKKEHLLSAELVNTMKKSSMIRAHDYLSALEEREILTKKSESLFKDTNVLISPTIPIVPPKISEEKKRNINGEERNVGDLLVRNTHIFNIIGYPAIVLPTNIYIRNIPFSIQLIARPNMDSELLVVAKSIEKKLMG